MSDFRATINNDLDVSLHRTQTLVGLIYNEVGNIFEAGLLKDSPMLNNISVLIETLERELDITQAAVERLRKAVKDKPDTPPAA